MTWFGDLDDRLAGGVTEGRLEEAIAQHVHRGRICDIVVEAGYALKTGRTEADRDITPMEIDTCGAFRIQEQSGSVGAVTSEANPFIVTIPQERLASFTSFINQTTGWVRLMTRQRLGVRGRTYAGGTGGRNVVLLGPAGTTRALAVVFTFTVASLLEFVPRRGLADAIPQATAAQIQSGEAGSLFVTAAQLKAELDRRGA